MDYTTLGRSGLPVSRACLGAMMSGHTDGSPTKEADSREMIDAVLDASRWAR